MIRINLLPYREKQKKETRKSEIIMLAASFALYLLILGGLALFMSSQISSLEQQIKEKEDRRVVLNKIIGEIEVIQADKKLMEKKLQVIQTLERNRLYPVQMLDQLATQVPSRDMWLEKIQETGKELTIEGTARDSIVVARFMKSLETAPFIQSVDLVSSAQKEIAGVKLQQFILKCVTRRGV